jgi:hypothetical protein
MKMASTQDCQGVARALMAIAADPGRTDELYGVLGEFCHGIRDRLNALKISLYVVNQSVSAEQGRCWQEVHEQYLGVEQFVDHFQTVFRPMSLNLMSVSLGRLLEENRDAWEGLIRSRGAKVFWSRPKTDPAGTFDPMRLIDALDRFVQSRVAELLPGTLVHVSWFSEDGQFRFSWEERNPPVAADQPPREECRNSMMALPMLARVMALHGGAVTARSCNGCSIELRWPMVARERGDVSDPFLAIDPVPLAARERF